jgi:hypothetical protein
MRLDGKHGIGRGESLSLIAGTDTSAFSPSVEDSRPCSADSFDQQ